jgi:hypothetical protein
VVSDRLVERSASGIVVATSDTAALTAELVAAGVRVAALAPQVRTLEEIVLSITTHGTDRIA